MKRGQLYAPGGYLLDCMDCDKQVEFTDAEKKRSSETLYGMGWSYFRGWYCPECAKECGIAPTTEAAEQAQPEIM